MTKPKLRPIKTTRSKPDSGLTLDTGALIAFERNKRRLLVLLDAAIEDGLPIRTPAAVVGEFWRGQHVNAVRAFVEATCVPDTLDRARRAGEALALVGCGPSVVDALVAAVASEQGDRILSSDPTDLEALAAHFGRLKVLAV